jgi:hypothetical protein
MKNVFKSLMLLLIALGLFAFVGCDNGAGGGGDGPGVEIPGDEVVVGTLTKDEIASASTASGKERLIAKIEKALEKAEGKLEDAQDAYDIKDAILDELKTEDYVNQEDVVTELEDNLEEANDDLDEAKDDLKELVADYKEDWEDAKQATKEAKDALTTAEKLALTKIDTTSPTTIGYDLAYLNAVKAGVNDVLPSTTTTITDAITDASSIVLAAYPVADVEDLTAAEIAAATAVLATLGTAQTHQTAITTKEGIEQDAKDDYDAVKAAKIDKNLTSGTILTLVTGLNNAKTTNTVLTAGLTAFTNVGTITANIKTEKKTLADIGKSIDKEFTKLEALGVKLQTAKDNVKIEKDRLALAKAIEV